MTTSISAVKILNQVLLVNLDVHIWSGRKKLNPEDLQNVQSSDLPPTALASLGSKKIIDTDKLKVFDTLKKRAHRTCELAGVRFLGGYAIPLTRVAEVAKELDSIEVEFSAATDIFIQNYKGNVESWVGQHANWAHAIKDSVTHVGHVESAISFAWQAIHVKEPTGKGKLLNRGISKQVSGLSDQLFKEISSSAKEMLEKVLCGNDKVTQKALNRVRQLRDKLHDLSFLNTTVQPLVQSIDYMMTLMPKTGAIEGIAFDTLFQMVSLLSDQGRAMQHGLTIVQGKSVADAMSECVLGASIQAQVIPAEQVPGAQTLVSVTEANVFELVTPEETKPLSEAFTESITVQSVVPKANKNEDMGIPPNQPPQTVVEMEAPVCLF